MEQKTKIHAGDGKQELTIAREFELPVELLFRAYEDPEIVEQWMGTKIIELESKRHGRYQFETNDANGNVVFKAYGAIHDCIPNKRIVRTFEMENAPFGVQLEVYEFEPLTDGSSKLHMHVIYESVEQRDQLMRLPFAHGLNMAHNRLQDIVSKLK